MKKTMKWELNEKVMSHAKDSKRMRIVSRVNPPRKNLNWR